MEIATVARAREEIRKPAAVCRHNPSEEFVARFRMEAPTTLSLAAQPRQRGADERPKLLEKRSCSRLAVLRRSMHYYPQRRRSAVATAPARGRNRLPKR